MATEKTKQLRNWAHPITTSILLYCMGYFMNLKYEMTVPSEPYYSIFQMFLLSLFAGFVVAGILGVAYEIPYKRWIFKEQDDALDIIRSIYGGVAGLAIYFICPFVPVIVLYILLGIIVIGIVVDFINSIVNYNKKRK